MTRNADADHGSSSRTPSAVWRSAMEAYLRGDIEAYADRFASDGRIELPFSVPGLPSRMEGREAIRGVLGPLWARALEAGRWPEEIGDVRVHQTTDPAVAVMEFEVRGTRPDGAPSRHRYVHVVETRGARIAVLRDYVDTLMLARAVAPDATPS